MKAAAGAHLQLNLILHRHKSKIVHVKKARKELFLFPLPSSLLFFCVRETKLFRAVLLKNRACAGATLANPNGEGSRDDCGSKKPPKLIKETQEKNPSGDFSSSFCAWVKKVWLKEKKKKRQQPQRCSTAATQMLKQTNSNFC